MAKATKDEDKNLPATVAPGGVPAFMQERMEQDAGKGVSKDAEDNVVPLMYVLQTNSPQVNSRDEAYLKGAVGGDIWLRNALNPVVPGQKGVLFQPCCFYKDWVEWVPRSEGGGLVGRFAERPKEAVEKPDTENPKKMVWTLPNGNHVVETRYHVGYAILEDGVVIPYVIPMKGSGHSVSKQWMFLMGQKCNAKGDAYPSWSSTYRITTELKKKGGDSWFVFHIEDNGFVSSMEDYERGARLNAAFMAGQLKAAEDTEADEKPAADHSDNASM
jgi:hypothetical protein